MKTRWLTLVLFCPFVLIAAPERKALETQLDTLLSADSIRERLRVMTAEPNQVGSAHNKKIAGLIRDEFARFGWEARIETSEALYPTPRELSLELLEPTRFKATLQEPPIEGDTTARVTKDVLPDYVAYSADGDVTGALVYVNYGMPADYEQLERMGVDVRGRIVIARYGNGWRGLKPKLAYEHGAIGCILYSDPAADGFATNLPYPQGPARPEEGVQRGSVADTPRLPGDPGKRYAQSVMRIPVLPISWGDALHFLSAIGGPIAPPSFRGALPITYRIGPGTGAARLVVKSDWSKKKLYNVIATIKGSTWPDEWILRGNHHDAWVFGAADPHSGHSAMLEEAKAIGALVKQGYKPGRTLVYASWDGEEPGLLGSNNWAIKHEKALMAHAVAYLNTDNLERSVFGGVASHSLTSFINETLADVTDPEAKVSLKERALADLRVRALSPDAGPAAEAAKKSALLTGELPMGDLGSGSDYSPFIHHLGIPSVSFWFSGEGNTDGIYHSAYDTFEHYTRFGDPGLSYTKALAQVGARLVMRLADAKVLPFRFEGFAMRVQSQLEDIKALLVAQSARDSESNTLRAQHAFALAAGPLGHGDPSFKQLPPPIDFGPMDLACQKLYASAKAYDQQRREQLSPQKVKKLNAVLRRLERSLLQAQGLKGRPWYKHLLVAPGLNTGYAAKTLPAIRESIEERRYDDTPLAIKQTAAVINAYAQKLDEARKQLD